MLLINKTFNEQGLSGLINNLEQTESLELGNLRLELFNKKDSVEYELLTLSNALKNNKIKIEEVSESGNVPELKCKNLSKELILILAGEEIIGAKQNRITNISFIVPPYAEIKIPVSCVEQGRWSYKSSKFSKGYNAYPDLKRKLYEDVIDNNTKGRGYRSNQSRIWSDIQQKQHSFNKYSSTSAMNEMYSSTDELNNFLNKNKNIHGSGMATFINGSLASFEMLPNEIFFNQIFSDLVKSVYQESLLYKNTSRTYSSFFSSSAFFNYLKKLDHTEKRGVGLGENNHIQSHSICGDFLSLENDIIHLYSFPKSNKLNHR
mgnify:CR=1 FL=1